jgi:hypothetical protein
MSQPTDVVLPPVVSPVLPPVPPEVIFRDLDLFTDKGSFTLSEFDSYIVPAIINHTGTEGAPPLVKWLRVHNYPEDFIKDVKKSWYAYRVPERGTIINSDMMVESLRQNHKETVPTEENPQEHGIREYVPQMEKADVSPEQKLAVFNKLLTLLEGKELDTTEWKTLLGVIKNELGQDGFEVVEKVLFSTESTVPKYRTEVPKQAKAIFDGFGTVAAYPKATDKWENGSRIEKSVVYVFDDLVKLVSKNCGIPSKRMDKIVSEALKCTEVNFGTDVRCGEPSGGKGPGRGSGAFFGDNYLKSTESTESTEKNKVLKNSGGDTGIERETKNNIYKRLEKCYGSVLRCTTAFKTTAPTLPPTFPQVAFPDIVVNSRGEDVPRSTEVNIRAILGRLGFGFVRKLPSREPLVHLGGHIYTNLNLAVTDLRIVFSHYGIKIDKGYIIDLIEKYCDLCPINFFLEKVVFAENHEGEGTPYLDALLNSIDFNPEMAVSVEWARRFITMQMVGCVRAQKDNSTQFHTVLGIEGGQGIGKSTFVRKLFTASDGDSEWFTGESQPDFENKEDRIRYCQYVAVEMAEVEGLDRKEFGVLKRFLSNNKLSVTLKYQNYGTEIIKNTCGFLTGNRLDCLNDPTGSRRFNFIQVKKFNWDSLPADWTVEKLWADINYMEEQGYRHWINSEEEEELFSARTATFGGDTTFETLLAEKFDFNADKATWEEINTAQLFSTLRLDIAKDFNRYRRQITPAIRNLSKDPNFGSIKKGGIVYFNLPPLREDAQNLQEQINELVNISGGYRK